MLDRLPDNVVPKHYQVWLEPDMERWLFAGHVDIDIDIHEAVDTIVMNALNITIYNAAIDDTSSHEINIDDQVVYFKFPLTLIGAKRISIDFEGVINENPGGLFKNSYKNDDNMECYMIATQLQAADCRRLLPCFDEPAFKATFDMSVVASADLIVLGNCAIQIEEIRSDGKIVTHFETTPRMSTYLLALAIGDLRCVESNAFRVPVRGWTVPGRQNEAEFAVSIATRVLKFYEELFGIVYPLPKMDLVATPNYPGAMENWGLVIFQESSVLYDPNRDSVKTQRNVGSMVMHELSHQWFGNLVTMQWWDGLWLNEGFATWVQMYASSKLFPEWRVWDMFVGPAALQTALEMDSLQSSHPIEVPLKSVAELTQTSNAITYSKGACVIRMLVQWLGEDVFFKGLKSYLHENSYSNATTNDLWFALGGKAIVDIMQKWTQQQGFPVVLVTEKDNCQGDKVIEIEQRRFLHLKNVPDSENHIYPIMLVERY